VSLLRSVIKDARSRNSPAAPASTAAAPIAEQTRSGRPTITDGTSFLHDTVASSKTGTTTVPENAGAGAESRRILPADSSGNGVRPTIDLGADSVAGPGDVADGSPLEPVFPLTSNSTESVEPMNSPDLNRHEKLPPAISVELAFTSEPNQSQAVDTTTRQLSGPGSTRPDPVDNSGRRTLAKVAADAMESAISPVSNDAAPESVATGLDPQSAADLALAPMTNHNLQSGPVPNLPSDAPRPKISGNTDTATARRVNLADESGQIVRPAASFSPGDNADPGAAKAESTSIPFDTTARISQMPVTESGTTDESLLQATQDRQQSSPARDALVEPQSLPDAVILSAHTTLSQARTDIRSADMAAARTQPIESQPAPQVSIGQVDVFVEAAQRGNQSASSSPRPSPSMASSFYLRRL
jgi:hypothetical protein